MNTWSPSRVGFIAVGLMLAGIAPIGVVTASFATWLIEQIREVEEEAQTATRRDVAELSKQIDALRAQVATFDGQEVDEQAGR